MPNLFFVSVTKRNSLQISERSAEPGPGLDSSCGHLTTCDEKILVLGLKRRLD